MKAIKKGTLVLSALFLWSCSNDQPYQQPVVRYFESQAKVVPIIDEIKVDTTASMESYAQYWQNRIAELKADLKKDYEEKYLQEKKDFESRTKQNEERAKKYRMKYTDVYGADYSSKRMTEYKSKLDSAEKGLFNYSVIEIFEGLSKEKTKLHQLTVKYKLNEGGTTMVQRFVIEELESDTTAYATDETLIKFIQKSGTRR